MVGPPCALPGAGRQRRGRTSSLSEDALCKRVAFCCCKVRAGKHRGGGTETFADACPNGSFGEPCPNGNFVDPCPNGTFADPCGNDRTEVGGDETSLAFGTVGFASVPTHRYPCVGEPRAERGVLGGDCSLSGVVTGTSFCGGVFVGVVSVVDVVDVMEAQPLAG